MGFSGYSLNCSGSEKDLFVRTKERSSEIFSVIDSNWFLAFNVLSRSLLFGNGHPEFDFYYAKIIVRCDFNGTYFVNDSCESSSIHFPISIIAQWFTQCSPTTIRDFELFIYFYQAIHVQNGRKTGNVNVLKEENKNYRKDFCWN